MAAVSTALYLILFAPHAVNRIEAFDTSELPWPCDTSNFDVRVNGWEPWPSQENAIEGGLLKWNGIKDYDATDVVTITLGFSTSAPDWNINRVPDPGGYAAANGFTDCGGSRTIEISSNLAGLEVLQKTAAHEMGHALDMNHVGQHDAFDVDDPYMRTCLPTTVFQQTSQDDEAKILHEGSGGPTLHANYGFEEMATATRPLWWGIAASGGVAYDDVSDSHWGNRGFKWDVGTSTSAYFFQSVRLTDVGRSVVARASIRKVTSASTTGFVYARMFTRRVDYVGIEPCSYPDVAGNQNNPTFPDGTAWVWRTNAKEVPTTSWVNHDFFDATGGKPATYTLDGPDASDLQLRFFSSVRLSGTSNYVEIRFDNARARFN